MLVMKIKALVVLVLSASVCCHGALTKCLGKVKEKCLCGDNTTLVSVFVEGCNEEPQKNQTCTPCPGSCKAFSFCKSCSEFDCLSCVPGRWGAYCDKIYNVDFGNDSKISPPFKSADEFPISTFQGKNKSFVGLPEHENDFNNSNQNAVDVYQGFKTSTYGTSDSYNHSSEGQQHELDEMSTNKYDIDVSVSDEKSAVISTVMESEIDKNSVSSNFTAKFEGPSSKSEDNEVRNHSSTEPPSKEILFPLTVDATAERKLNGTKVENKFQSNLKESMQLEYPANEKNKMLASSQHDSWQEKESIPSEVVGSKIGRKRYFSKMDAEFRDYSKKDEKYDGDVRDLDRIATKSPTYDFAEGKNNSFRAGMGIKPDNTWGGARLGTENMGYRKENKQAFTEAGAHKLGTVSNISQNNDFPKEKDSFSSAIVDNEVGKVENSSRIGAELQNYSNKSKQEEFEDYTLERIPSQQIRNTFEKTGISPAMVESLENDMSDRLQMKNISKSLNSTSKKYHLKTKMMEYLDYKPKDKQYYGMFEYDSRMSYPYEEREKDSLNSTGTVNEKGDKKIESYPGNIYLLTKNGNYRFPTSANQSILDGFCKMFPHLLCNSDSSTVEKSSDFNDFTITAEYGGQVSTEHFSSDQKASEAPGMDLEYRNISLLLLNNTFESIIPETKVDDFKETVGSSLRIAEKEKGHLQGKTNKFSVSASGNNRRYQVTASIRDEKKKLAHLRKIHYTLRQSHQTNPKYRASRRRLLKSNETVKRIHKLDKIHIVKGQPLYNLHLKFADVTVDGAVSYSNKYADAFESEHQSKISTKKAAASDESEFAGDSPLYSGGFRRNNASMFRLHVYHNDSYFQKLAIPFNHSGERTSGEPISTNTDSGHEYRTEETDGESAYSTQPRIRLVSEGSEIRNEMTSTTLDVTTKRIRIKRKAIELSWCPIERTTLNGELSCVVHSYMKKCNIECYAGYTIKGKREEELICDRQIGEWKPRMEPCQLAKAMKKRPKIDEAEENGDYDGSHEGIKKSRIYVKSRSPLKH